MNFHFKKTLAIGGNYSNIVVTHDSLLYAFWKRNLEILPDSGWDGEMFSLVKVLGSLQPVLFSLFSFIFLQVCVYVCFHVPPSDAVYPGSGQAGMGWKAGR